MFPIKTLMVTAMINDIYNYVVSNPFHIILLLVIASVISRQAQVLGFFGALFFVYVGHYISAAIIHYIFEYNAQGVLAKICEYVFTYFIAIFLIHIAMVARQNSEAANE